MNERQLSQFRDLITAAVGCLPEGIEPDAIARALIDGASSSGRCDVQSIATVCEAELKALNFGGDQSPTGNQSEYIAEMAIEAFRGSLDLLIDGTKGRGVVDAEIAQLLGRQAASVLEYSDPIFAEMFASAADHLPVPRGCAV